MAAIALHQSRTLFSALRLSWARSVFANTLPTLFASQRPYIWAIPGLQALLDLFPPFLLAVPKKKVSHSRKSMRSANKGLKDKRNIVNCPACGQPKLAHHLCVGCYTTLSRKWKREGLDNGVEMLEERTQLAFPRGKPIPTIREPNKLSFGALKRD